MIRRKGEGAGWGWGWGSTHPAAAAFPRRERRCLVGAAEPIGVAGQDEEPTCLRSPLRTPTDWRCEAEPVQGTKVDGCMRPTPHHTRHVRFVSSWVLYRGTTISSAVESCAQRKHGRADARRAGCGLSQATGRWCQDYFTDRS
jgi:hypothetical protein